MIPRRVVIDTDPGIDDVVALALAVRSPELQVVAVTTTYGNAPLALTTRNARHALRLAGRPDVPVLPGASRPLCRPLITAPETHGHSGVGHAPVPGPPHTVCPNPTVLLDVLETCGSPITLVTLGPLTNLATAWRGDPDLVRRRVRRHVGMFGSMNTRGSAKHWADFNTWSDPEAAHTVVESALDTFMVGLDVTRQLILYGQDVDRIGGAPDSLARWLAHALRFSVEVGNRHGRDGCVVNDVLTVAELAAPGLLGFESIGVGIDLGENENRGRTTEEGRDLVHAATAVDVPRAKRLMNRVFGRGWEGGLAG